MPPARPAPPAPENAASWSEFTGALRALYEWCGTPKYRALCGRTPGLSPAAVSNLIGRNPLTRPPETATARFAEACLRYRDWPDTEGELVRWTEQWKRLDQSPETAPVPAAEPATGAEATAPDDVADAAVRESGSGAASAPEGDTAPEEGPARRGAASGTARDVIAAPVGSGLCDGEKDGAERDTAGRRAVHGRRYAVIGVVVVAAALSAGIVAFVAAPPKTRSNPATSCQYLRGTIDDTRTKRTWAHLYQCPNQPGTDVYLEAASGTKVAVLDTDPSWFICWVRGERHQGGNDVWYYTQGDRATGRPELNGWGYVPASALHVARHPDPAVTKQCPT
ncbi:hypothetical protein [Actinomadura sp. 9N407]|uniref:hypothetical protein n=1 Tax=Actinomadura sp. 9N407 TaxID=3375154 RepID=UPI0037B2838A